MLSAYKKIDEVCKDLLGKVELDSRDATINELSRKLASINYNAEAIENFIAQALEKVQLIMNCTNNHPSSDEILEILLSLINTLNHHINRK